MKFTVSFKNPDAVDYALQEMNEDERREASRTINKFIEYGEYANIQFDTEKGTAVVLPC